MAGSAVPARVSAISLHVRVIGASAAFGDDPVDVLGRVLDVAGLAVDAILGVDLEPGASAFLDELVDSGRAVALLGAGIIRKVDAGGDARVLQRQVDRLVLLVIGVGD